MMSLKEIGTTAAALGNQIGAGIPIDQALSRMAQMQPQYSDFWHRTVQDIRSGHLLSDSLQEVWPKSLVSAVKAGEQSGRIDNIFKRIDETIELQLSLRSTVMQLGYPIGMGIAGLIVFLGFMVFVLPMLAKSLNSKSQSAIFEFSSWLSALVLGNAVALGIAAGLGVFTLIAWMKTPQAQASILEFCLNIPVLKDALGSMYFGLWSNYMAMMVSAGIPTTQALLLTAPILPGVLGESIEVFESDLSANKSIAASSDLATLPNDDLRAIWWPFYISNAFLVGEQTGEIDKELLRVAPALIKDGVTTMNRVVSIANVVALAISAALIVSPLAAYYAEIFSSIRTAGH